MNTTEAIANLLTLVENLTTTLEGCHEILRSQQQRLERLEAATFDGGGDGPSLPKLLRLC